MPFEQTQTLFRLTVPESREIKQRGMGAGKAAGHPSRFLVRDEEHLCGCL